jgi:uncharacterized protein
LAEPYIQRIDAVADASFLIGVCAIGRLSLLQDMFGRVRVAAAVWDEVAERRQGRPGADQITQASFIDRCPPANSQAVMLLGLFLDQGEAETLALALELSSPVVLMDELRARKAAQRAGLQTLGVAGFLLAAKRRGLIDLVRPHLDTLVASGFRLGQHLIDEVLREAKEQ